MPVIAMTTHWRQAGEETEHTQLTPVEVSI